MYDKTIRDVLEEISKLKTPSEAVKYLTKELQDNPHAWSNIKYITGYLGTDQRTRILKLFNGE